MRETCTSCLQFWNASSLPWTALAGWQRPVRRAVTDPHQRNTYRLPESGRPPTRRAVLEPYRLTRKEWCNQAFSTVGNTHRAYERCIGVPFNSKFPPSLSSEQTAPTAKTRHCTTPGLDGSCRHYSSRGNPVSKPSAKPTSTPTGLAGRRTANLQFVEAGLRKIDPPKNRMAAKRGVLGDSRLNQARTRRVSVVRLIEDLERQEKWTRTNMLKYCREDVSLWQSVLVQMSAEHQRLLAQFNSDLYFADIMDEIVFISRAVSGHVQAACEALRQTSESLRLKILQRQDKIHVLQAPQREAFWRSKWSNVQRALDGYSDGRSKKLSDLSGNISRFDDDLVGDYEDFCAEVAQHQSEHGFQSRRGELLLQINSNILSVFQGNAEITHKAHYARYYGRVRLFSAANEAAYQIDWRKEVFIETLSKLKISSRMINLWIGCINRLFWTRRHPGSISKARNRPNRCTDLSWLLLRNMLRLERLLDWSDFRPSLPDQDQKQILQLRRGSKATLKPFVSFLASVQGLLALMRARQSMLQSMAKRSPKLEGNTPGSSSCLCTWHYDPVLDSLQFRMRLWSREIGLMVDELLMANWWANKLRTRTVFTLPDPEPEILVSPITFAVPAHCKSNAALNPSDYRGPNGEVVTTWYCLDTWSMDKAISRLQHNGVVSIDVRWAPEQPTRPGRPRPYFGHDVSVVTIASQSQIVICQFSRQAIYRLEENISVELKRLLIDRRVIKVGVGMKALQERFKGYLNIDLAATCNLPSLHALVQSISPTQAQDRLCNNTWQDSQQKATLGDAVWLHNLSLNQLQRVTGQAYTCLQLFFELSKVTVNSACERLIPIYQGATSLNGDLGLLFALITSRENITPTETVGEFDRENASQSRTVREEVGPIHIPRTGREWVRCTRDIATELADRRVKAQPRLTPWTSNFRLYHLWRTFEWACDDIEARLPRPRSNLPALILEVIEKAELPYHQQAYQALQKVALIQFIVDEKMLRTENQSRFSTLNQLPKVDLDRRINEMMGLIRAKIKAEEWMYALSRNLATGSRVKHQDLLPYAMWHIGRASVLGIARMLILPSHRVAASILNETRTQNFKGERPEESLTDVAQLTENPGFWLKIVEDIHQRHAKSVTPPIIHRRRRTKKQRSIKKHNNYGQSQVVRKTVATIMEEDLKEGRAEKVSGPVVARGHHGSKPHRSLYSRSEHPRTLNAKRRDGGSPSLASALEASSTKKSASPSRPRRRKRKDAMSPSDRKHHSTSTAKESQFISKM